MSTSNKRLGITYQNKLKKEKNKQKTPRNSSHEISKQMQVDTYLKISMKVMK